MRTRWNWAAAMLAAALIGISEPVFSSEPQDDEIRIHFQPNVNVPSDLAELGTMNDDNSMLVSRAALSGWIQRKIDESLRLFCLHDSIAQLEVSLGFSLVIEGNITLVLDCPRAS